MDAKGVKHLIVGKNCTWNGYEVDRQNRTVEICIHTDAQDINIYIPLIYVKHIMDTLISNII